jgi:hypothetical protein
MASFATFDRDVKLATAALDPKEINAQLAMLARTELATAIQSGEGSPIYTRYVDGTEGASEDSVEAPGPILYVFSWWRPIVEFALADLIKRSPRRTGRFASSFIVICRDKVVTDYNTLTADDEVIITNYQPYVRKVQVGAMSMSVPPEIFDATRSAVVKQFGSGKNGFGFSVQFLSIDAGVHPLIPYRLKGEYAARYYAQRARIRSGEAIPHSQRLRRRQDRDVGQPITYPALIMNMTVH